MSRTLANRFLLTAILAGMGFGLLTPKLAHATTLFYIYLHPAASYLTCGWHTGACYDDDSQMVSGWALDWNYGGNSSFTVNWVSKSNNSSGGSWAGTGNISYYSSGSCRHETTVTIRDIYGTWQDATVYVHTSSSQGGTYFYINSGYYPQTTTTSIGPTAYESGCSWSGYHTHIEASGGWESQLSYPDHTTCNLPYMPNDCGTYDNYTYPMYQDYWSY